MKATVEPPASPLPSAAVPTEIRLLAELHSIQTTLVTLTEIMARMAETLERAARRI